MAPLVLLSLALAAPQPDFKPDQNPLPVPAPKGATVLLDEKGKHSFLSMAGDKIDWPVEDGVLDFDVQQEEPEPHRLQVALPGRGHPRRVPAAGEGDGEQRGLHPRELRDPDPELVRQGEDHPGGRRRAVRIRGAAGKRLPEAGRVAGVRHPLPRPAAGRRWQDHREGDRHGVVQREEGAGQHRVRRAQVDVPPVPVRQHARTWTRSGTSRRRRRPARCSSRTTATR